MLWRCDAKTIISVRDNMGSDSEMRERSSLMAISLSLKFCCATRAHGGYYAASAARHRQYGWLPRPNFPILTMGSLALKSEYPHIKTRTACAKLSGGELKSEDRLPIWSRLVSIRTGEAFESRMGSPPVARPSMAFVAFASDANSGERRQRN